MSLADLLSSLKDENVPLSRLISLEIQESGPAVVFSALVLVLLNVERKRESQVYILEAGGI